MARKKNLYYKSEVFPAYFHNFKLQNAKFELHTTAYTKKLSSDTHNIFFNKDGSGDNRVLSLINKVREDANNYLKRQTGFSDMPVDYFNLLRPPPEGVVCKVDLNGAYWKCGLIKGVITNEADMLLKNLFAESSPKQIKGARTKALGSLATKKTIYYYENGRRVSERDEYVSEETREIYIDICRGVDDLMKECALEIPDCIYYYWDCMFVPKGMELEVVEFFKSKEYDCKIEETSLEFIKIGEYGYIYSMSDDKMYMTRRENKHLLEGLY